MSYILIGILTVIIALFSPIISIFMPTDETPKEPEIKTVTFDGITYKNHFIEEYLFLVEDFNFYNQEPDYREDFYKLDNGFLYNGHTQQYDSGISALLYCTEEKWNEYKAYYSDSENFDYSYFESHYHTSPNDKTITVSDGETFNKLLGDEWDIRDNTQSIVKISDSAEYHSFFLKKTSKDGLFYGNSDEFVIYEGRVYHKGTHIGQYHEIYLYILDSEIETYVADILKTNGFEACFD